MTHKNQKPNHKPTIHSPGASWHRKLTACMLVALLLSLGLGASTSAWQLNYRLIHNLPAQADVETRFKINPSDDRVVYLAYQAPGSQVELFSVPAGGGDSLKLNAPLVADGNVSWFNLSPDGVRVVYMADQQVYGKNELYSVPVSGGPAVKINGPLDADKSVWDYKISPDSSRVLYSLQENIPSVGIYSVPIGGGTPVQLFDRYVYDFVITADSSQVVYSAFSLTGGLIELSRVPIGGETSATPITSLAESWTTSEFDVSPDGVQVVYVAEQGASVYEIYSVPIEGGSPVKLGSSLSPSPPGVDPKGSPEALANCIEKDGQCRFLVSPDSSRVVYWADQESNEVYELFTVPIDGGTSVRLNSPLVSGGDVDRFSLSPSGNRVVYLADQETDGMMELFSVPITGGMPIKHNTTLSGGGNIHDFQISPDGIWVVYYGEQDVSGIAELYRAPIDGGPPIKLNGSLISGGDVSGVQYNPTGESVVYRADQEIDNKVEFFATRMSEFGLFLPIVRH